jgi:transcription elongation factor
MHNSHYKIIFLGLAAMATSQAETLTFANGGPLDNHSATSTAIFTDVTITTITLGGTATALNENAETLGAIGGNDNTRWDAGESWTFEFNQHVRLDSFSFGVFTNSTQDQATLQSDVWIGKNYTETDADLWFDNTTGTFTFSGGSNRTFDLTGIVPSNVELSAFDNLVFANTGIENFTLTGFSFTVVPEPSTYPLLLGVCGLAYTMLRRRR